MIEKSEREQVLDTLYRNLYSVMGVTRFNEKFVCRWLQDNELVSVSLIATAVTTPADAKAIEAKSNRYKELFAKHPELEADIFYAEYGQWPK